MDNNYNSYSSYQNPDDNNYENSEQFEQSNDNLYTDNDNKPKLLIIIGIIILLAIIFLIFYACSRKGPKSSNNYLQSLSVSGGELIPNFDRDVFDYLVSTKQESVVFACSGESNKSRIDGCNRTVVVGEQCVSHTVKVVAENKSIRNYSFKICNNNGEEPVIGTVISTPDKYTNSDVSVKINAVAGDIALHDEAYSIDDGVTWHKSNVFVVKENQILKIKVRNKEGVSSEVKEYSVTNIDKTVPEVTVKGSKESGVSTTSNVELYAYVSPTYTSSGYTYQWYKNGSKISKATSSNYLVTSSGKYKVIVKTGAGSTVTSSEYVVNKKSTNTGNGTSSTSNYTLIIEKVERSSDSWTSSLKLTVKAKSSIGGLKYSFDGGKTYQTSNSKIFTENKPDGLKIVVKDAKNNTESHIVYFSKIDKTKPDIKISGNLYVNNQLSVVVNPSKTPSGYSYYWYNNGGTVVSKDSKFTPTSAGKYKVKVVTGANVYSEKEFSVSSSPTVKISGNSASGSWSISDVTLTAITSGDDVKSYVWYKGTEKLASTGKTLTINSDTNSKYKVEVTFKNGSVITSSDYSVKIEKNLPNLTISGNYVGTKMEITSKTPISGYKSYQWYKDGAKIDKAISSSYTPNNAGKYKLVVVTNAGKTLNSNQINIINKVAPSAKLTGGSSTWTSNDVKLTVTTSNVSDFNPVVNYSWTRNSKVSGCSSSTCNISKEGEGTYVVKVTLKDGTVLTTGSQIVRIDKLAPLEPKISFKVNGEKVQFTVSDIKDEGSGVKSVEYKVGKDGSWINYKSGSKIDVTPNSKGSVNIYVRVTDNMGRKTEINKQYQYPVSCTITKSNINTTDGVTLTVSSNYGVSYKFGGGTFGTSNKKTNVKSDMTVTVKDSYDNTGTCSVKVSEKTQYSYRTRSVVSTNYYIRDESCSDGEIDKTDYKKYAVCTANTTKYYCDPFYSKSEDKNYCASNKVKYNCSTTQNGTKKAYEFVGTFSKFSTAYKCTKYTAWGSYSSWQDTKVTATATKGVKTRILYY